MRSNEIFSSAFSAKVTTAVAFTFALVWLTQNVAAQETVEQRLKNLENRVQALESNAGGGNSRRVPRQDEADSSRMLNSENGRQAGLAQDSDGDGLTDAEEQLLNTDPANPDTDGDALLDGWEVHGVNGLDLRAMGASPRHKDIFVEMDFMSRQSASNGLGPNANVIDAIKYVFASAIVSNPDGQRGINIHLEVGNEVPYDPNLSPAVVEFNAIKAANFDSNRAPVFHYMLWADRYNGTTSSGNSFAIPNSDFIVTLGAWNSGQGGTDNQKIGTFIHELGHNLGLKHGGSTHRGFKPNHLSVMNYSFQTSGILVDGERRFDYQRFPIPELDERFLSESFGLGGSMELEGYHTKIRTSFSSQEVDADDSIDWNGNGNIDSLNQNIDINGDTQMTRLLSTPNEWQQLIYNGGTIGSTGSISGAMSRQANKRVLLPFVELTEEMDRRINNPNQ